MRAVLVCLLIATTAHAAPKKPPKKPEATEKKPAEDKPAEVKPARSRTPDDDKALEILKRIEAGTGDRKAAIEELVKAAPHAVDELGDWLARTHVATVDDRRKALVAIDAAVPDEKGRFPERTRQTAKEMKADDEIDWQAKLLELPAGTVGLGEVVADVATLRALSLTKDIRAAQVIFDAAFLPETMIYRDECGRYVRKMEPYSIPALTREAQRGTDRKRYATWQLERLDRQDPIKALNAATGSEELKVAILEVFRTTKLREAVRAVWLTVNDDAPRVRAAARATWMDYITGPAPRPAPKAKLKLPGGKLTKKEKPLWLTYRELADNELRMAANELLHEDYPIEDETRLDDRDSNAKVVKIDLEDVTKRMFEYYDGERGKQERDQWSAAKAKADAGDLPSAIAMIDRLIATNPERAERAEMSKLYGQYGKALEAKQQWAEASAAYSKAHGLDPQGSGANATLAAHHYTLGKALEAQGKDGGPDFRKAQQLKPDFTPAVIAATRASTGGKPTWMLYAAALAVATAAALFAMAMLRRRAA
jgi:tetratricopeptide (TPR) repeat protein